MKEIKLSREKKAERRFYTLQTVIYILTIANLLALVISVAITSVWAEGLNDGLIFIFEVLDIILPGVGFVSTVWFNCNYCSYKDYKKDEVERMIKRRSKREAKNIWLF